MLFFSQLYFICTFVMKHVVVFRIFFTCSHVLIHPKSAQVKNKRGRNINDILQLVVVSPFCFCRVSIVTFIVATNRTYTVVQYCKHLHKIKSANIDITNSFCVAKQLHLFFLWILRFNGNPYSFMVFMVYGTPYFMVFMVYVYSLSFCGMPLMIWLFKSCVPELQFLDI